MLLNPKLTCRADLDLLVARQCPWQLCGKGWVSIGLIPGCVGIYRVVYRFGVLDGTIERVLRCFIINGCRSEGPV